MNDTYKITSADMVGHLVAELEDQPSIGATPLKEKFDDVSVNVIVPAINAVANDFATQTWVINQMGEAGQGDMLKATYDTDNDGKVDAAEVADALYGADGNISSSTIWRTFADVSGTLLAANWGDTAPYTHVVTTTNTGIKTTDTAFVEPNYGNDNNTNIAIRDAYACVDYAEITDDDEITFYCFEEKPSADIPYKVTIVR